jgi:hypothetical protein
MSGRISRSVLAAVVVALVAILWAETGHASSLATGTATLGDSSAGVTRCDTDGFTITPTIVGTATTVSGLTVAGINAACAGQTLTADVNNGLANSTASAVVPAGGGSVSLTLATAVAGREGIQYDVTVSG